MSLSAFALASFSAALLSGAAVILNSALQLLRHQDAQVGWFAALAALIAAFATLVTLFIHAFVLPYAPDRVAVLAGMGGVELLFGLLLLVFVERRRDTFAADRSYGLLAAGVGFLAVVAAIFLPVLPGQLFPSPSPTPVLAVTPVPSITPTQLQTPGQTPSATTFTSTALPASDTPTTIPTFTPTPTRRPYRTPTSTPTPTAFTVCSAVVNYNLNLRAVPSGDASILLVIPYTARIQVAGQNEDGSWWFVGYNEVWGWVDTRYIALDPACASAPVYPN